MNRVADHVAAGIRHLHSRGLSLRFSSIGQRGRQRHRLRSCTSAIDIDTYDRHADRVREQITLLKIDEHTSKLEELDVEGILAFAERVLPRAADLWVQASLDQRQRLQQLFFPQGVAFDGNGFFGTVVTAPAFSYLRPVEGGGRDICEFEPSGQLAALHRAIDASRPAGDIEPRNLTALAFGGPRQ